MNKKFIIAAAVILICAAAIPKLAENNRPQSRQGFLMDTSLELTVYDKGDNTAVLEEAYREIERLDNLLNTYNEESEVAELNRKGELICSDELFHVIKEAVGISESSGGAFDITVKPLSQLWNFKNETVPGENEIKGALEKVGFDNIEIKEENRVILNNGAQIDLGGIAKGYAADAAVRLLKNRGVKNALADIGGNIAVIGNSDKSKEGFKIGIQDPDEQRGIPMGSLVIKDCSLVTSGIYERNFVRNGKLYHHIIDPKTGFPSESGLKSVSVLSRSSTDADALATVVMVMGAERGISYINSIPDAECIIITEDNKIIMSDKMTDLEILNDKYKR